MTGFATHRVAGINTGVKDVRASTGTSAVIEDVAGSTVSTVGDTSQTPGGTGLGGVGLDGHDGILLDVVDIRVVTQGLEGGLVEVAGEAAEGSIEDVLGGLGQDAGDGTVDGGEGGVVLELDNVAVGDEIRGVDLGDAERGRLGALG